MRDPTDLQHSLWDKWPCLYFTNEENESRGGQQLSQAVTAKARVRLWIQVRLTPEAVAGFPYAIAAALWLLRNPCMTHWMGWFRGSDIGEDHNSTC